jgi:hypothetical protein
VDTHFSNESPAVDAFDLQCAFGLGLVGVGAGEAADLEKESRGEADGYGGRGTETGADRESAAESVDGAWEGGRAEGEEKIEEGGGGGLVDFAV